MVTYSSTGTLTPNYLIIAHTRWVIWSTAYTIHKKLTTLRLSKYISPDHSLFKQPICILFRQLVFQFLGVSITRLRNNQTNHLLQDARRGEGGGGEGEGEKIPLLTKQTDHHPLSNYHFMIFDF